MVSVIIPSYNSSKTIKKCIYSVLSQKTNEKIEIIVVNDGSTDESKTIIEKIILENTSPTIIKLLDKANGGVSSARNMGLKCAKGDFIALLDSDDEWLDNKIDKQLRIFNTQSDIFFLGALINQPSSQISSVVQIDLLKLIFKNYFQPSTVVFKREILSEVGYFEETQKYAEEGNYFIRIASKFKCHLLNEKLVNYGQGKMGFGISGLSSNLIEMEKGELRNITYAYKNKYISLFIYALAIVYSIIKFFRRILIIKLKKC